MTAVSLVSATSLAQLSLGSAARWALPASSLWASMMQHRALADVPLSPGKLRVTEYEDEQQPLKIKSSLPVLRHRLTALPPGSTASGLGRSVAGWPTGRSFASQAEPQMQEAPQPPQDQPRGSQESARPDRPPHDVTYFGPLSQQHKLLKRISIANTLVAVAAAPAIVAWADNISLVSRYGLAVSLVFFGMLTTGALHWVAHPYAHELKYTAATGQIEVRTTTLLGSSRWHSFNVDDVQPLPWNRPVATFTARGQFYYIDTFNFPDEQLLRKLTPDENDVPKGYKDEEDDD